VSEIKIAEDWNASVAGHVLRGCAWRSAHWIVELQGGCGFWGLLLTVSHFNLYVLLFWWSVVSGQVLFLYLQCMCWFNLV